MVKNKNAHAPFALGVSSQALDASTKILISAPAGRYSCVGKNLALQELRCVTALLASKYDISFPPGEDGKSVEDDTLDHFTSSPGELKVIFRERDKS